jgi:nifR3 family TIM-barrel protein
MPDQPEQNTAKPKALPWHPECGFPLYLAPMAGYTDLIYRELCKEEGADVLVSEFVMCDAINLNHPGIWETVAFSQAQRPMGIQIFGPAPQAMAEAARRICDRCAPDFIDLNFGCPAEKVTCQSAGASLLREPEQLLAIARAVVQAVPDTPVTAKIRIGWDEQTLVAGSLAPRLEGIGIKALTIHGRTRVQGYSGDANWDLIREIADQNTLPIIGNGNIRDSSQVYDLHRNSNIKGVMIGRAALGYPWIFNEIKNHLASGLPPLPPTLEQRWKTLIRYARMLSGRPARQNPKQHIMWMRPKLIKLTKDMIGCKTLRLELIRVETLDDLETLAITHIERHREDEIHLFEKLSSLRHRRRIPPTTLTHHGTLHHRQSPHPEPSEP